MLDSQTPQSPAHVDYPHIPGYLYDCPACESACHCPGTSAAIGTTECVYPGPHTASPTAPLTPETAPESTLAAELGLPHVPGTKPWVETLRAFGTGRPGAILPDGICVLDRSACTADDLLVSLIREGIACGMEREDFDEWPTWANSLVRYPQQNNPLWSAGVGPGVLIANLEAGMWMEDQYITVLDWLNEHSAPGGYMFHVEDNSLYLSTDADI